MFENAGEKIKKFVEVMFWFMSVAYGITAFVGLCKALGGEYDFERIIGLYILLGGAVMFFLNWFICLLGYGFGEIVENAEHPTVSAVKPNIESNDIGKIELPRL